MKLNLQIACRIVIGFLTLFALFAFLYAYSHRQSVAFATSYAIGTVIRYAGLPLLVLGLVYAGYRAFRTYAGYRAAGTK